MYWKTGHNAVLGTLCIMVAGCDAGQNRVGQDYFEPEKTTFSSVAMNAPFIQYPGYQLVMAKQDEGIPVQEPKTPAVPEELPDYLKDRGRGTPTDMFGTYARRGELLIYPFYEYYTNKDEEYNPKELGFGLDQDFEGKHRENEWLLYIGYGLTDDIVIAIEAAVFTEATQEKSPNDTSAMPSKLTESGVGDIGTHLHWRWKKETATSPGFFTTLEIDYPFQKDKVIIGTQDWEFGMGFAVIKGFRWGTVTGKLGIEYDGADDEVGLGESAVEYLKRLSPSWRIYLAIEGDADEIELITEAQWHLSDRVFIKFNSAYGLTPAATDWAPEIGVMMSFPLGGPNE